MHQAEHKFAVASTTEHTSELLLDQEIARTKSGQLKVAKTLDQIAQDNFMARRMPSWQAALNAFSRAHESEESRKGYCPSVVRVAEEIIECLQFAEPPPNGAPFAASVVLFHPTDRGALKVFSASAASVFPRNYSFDERHLPSAFRKTCVDAWNVMHTANALAISPLGSSAILGNSVFPLCEEATGRCFGVLISGAPEASPAPDELLRRLAKLAGPQLERTWKLQNVGQMVKVAANWITKLAFHDHRSVEVHWTPGMASTVVSKRVKNGADWEPLMYHSGDTMKHFEMELRWHDPMHPHNQKHTLGTLTVDCTGVSEMDDQMVELLHTTAPLVQRCVDEIAAMHVFDPCPMTNAEDLNAAFAHARLLLPNKLQAEMRRQIHLLDPSLLQELATYEHVSDGVHDLVKGVLVLLGHDRHELPHKWMELRPMIQPATLVDRMLDLDLTSETKEMKKRWCESHRVTAGVDFKKLLTKEAVAGAPTRVLVKWLLATRLVHQVILTIKHETEEHADEHLEGKGVGEVNKPGKQQHGHGHKHAHRKHGGKAPHHKDKGADAHATPSAGAPAVPPISAPHKGAKALPPLGQEAAAGAAIQPPAKPLLHDIHDDCGARGDEQTFEQIMDHAMGIDHP